MTLIDGIPAGNLVTNAKRWRKEARAMTMKERLKVHRAIEAENRRKLDAWKGGRAA